MKELLLIINPGSTSTKCAVYSMKNSKIVFEEELKHNREELETFGKLIDQTKFRKKLILNIILKNGYSSKDFAAIVGRGGLVHPCEGGAYKVNEKMIAELSECRYGTHASNLGAIISNKIGKEWSIDAFIVDPVTVDEFNPLAYVSGFKGIERKSRSHALNIRQVARLVADKIGKKFEEINFIGLHIGGGISVVAIEKAKFIDTNNALLGDGPFSSERAGTLPLEGIIDMAYSGKYTKEQLRKILSKKAGLFSYLGTSNFLEILDRIKSGDEGAKFIVDAFAYRIAKTIGEMATVLKGKIDAIFFTGGIARSEYIINILKERISFIAKTYVISGQYEMTALGRNIEMVLNGLQEIKKYEY